MGWRRERSQLRVVPRADDGSPLIGPGEADEIREGIKAELAPVDDRPFPVAEFNRRYNAALARRCEIAARQRARALPVKATAATAAAGTAGWGVAALAELLAGPGGHLIATAGTPAAAAIALTAVRLTHRRRIADWSRTFTVSAVGGVGVATAAVALGPAAWPLLGALLVGGAAWVSAPWMRAHTVPTRARPAVEHRPPPELLPGRDEQRLDDVTAFAAEWHRLVARQNGKAAGSVLTDGTRTENYLEYALTMDGQTLTQLQGRAVEIASDLDVDPLQLVFDSPPANPDGWRSAKRATLRYVTRSPILTVVDYTGPRYQDGRIGIGPHVDGEGWGEWVLFGENSMRNGVVIGSTGSGKSGLMNGLVASGRASRQIVTIYLDPKRNSSPELAKTAAVPVLGLERADEFTTAVETLIYGRGLESAVHDWPGFEGSPGRPGYWVIIDECDMLFALPGMAARWGMIAKTGRALGVGLLLATQIDGVMAFGNNEMLRSNVAVGNVVLMRTESASSGGKLIAPDLPSSRTLPANKPGYAYLRAEDARLAPLRAAHLRSVQDCPDGYNALTALRQYPDAPMCAIGRRAFAAFLTGDPEQRREQDKDRMRAQLGALLEGTERIEVTAPQQSTGFEDLIQQVPAALTADNVIPLRRGTPTATVDARLSEAERVMLAAVRAGHTRSHLIIHHTGLAGPRVSNIGKKLAGMGLLVDGGHGVWTVPGSEGVGA